jgi:hypothetical protein
MLHLTKLAVGISGVAHLHAVQTERAAIAPPLRHRTRHFPRRAAEIVNGGSMYWVIAGATLVRQRLLAIERDHWDDGSTCAALILDPVLVPVVARATKPFQGWRYLTHPQAPPDLALSPVAEGEAELPPALRQELRLLGLL